MSVFFLSFFNARKPGKTTPPEEDETPVVIPSSAVTMHPKGTPAPASSAWRHKCQVFEERVDLSNDMTWRQMIAVGVRRVVLARGELDRLEGPGYAARRTELRRKAKEAARTRLKGPAGGGVAGRGRRERRDRGGNDKGENDESGTTARWHEGCSEKRRETAKRDRKRQTP